MPGEERVSGINRSSRAHKTRTTVLNGNSVFSLREASSLGVYSLLQRPPRLFLALSNSSSLRHEFHAACRETESRRNWLELCAEFDYLDVKVEERSEQRRVPVSQRLGKLGERNYDCWRKNRWSPEGTWAWSTIRRARWLPRNRCNSVIREDNYTLPACCVDWKILI